MKEKRNFFWIGYSDMMTSMFFIMLVLYIITYVILQQQLGRAEADAAKLKEIENVEKAIQTIDTNYFEFDQENKRFRLNIDVNFHINSYDINDIPIDKRREILKAGQSLFKKVKSVIDTNTRIDYLMVIEGNTQRVNGNWINNPNGGYRLSYLRALSLYNYWKANNLDFRELGSQCEVMIAGSGYFSQSRDMDNEIKNRRFTIQITSKVGKFLTNKEKEVK